MSTKGDVKKLIKKALAAGWEFQDGSSGNSTRHAQKLISPDGETIIPPMNPGSGKAVIAFRQKLRKRGVKV